MCIRDSYLGGPLRPTGRTSEVTGKPIQNLAIHNINAPRGHGGTRSCLLYTSFQLPAEFFGSGASGFLQQRTAFLFQFVVVQQFEFFLSLIHICSGGPWNGPPAIFP